MSQSYAVFRDHHALTVILSKYLAENHMPL